MSLTLREIQAEVVRVGAEAGARAAVQRLLDKAGTRNLSRPAPGQTPDGRRWRVYVWDRTPLGALALAATEGALLVVPLIPVTPGLPSVDDGLYVATVPALVAAPGTMEAYMPRRNNTSADGPAFATLDRAVRESRTESAQINLVARTLAGMGYSKAANPEVYTTSIDRATYRVYVWRDTPYGDHVVLGTGPSFEPKLALGAQVPSEPGIGVYVRAQLDKSPSRTLAGAKRAAARGAPRERSVAPPRERKPRISVRPPEPERPTAPSWHRADVEVPARRRPVRREAEGDFYAPTRPAPTPSRGGAAEEKAELLGGLDRLADKLAALRRR